MAKKWKKKERKEKVLGVPWPIQHVGYKVKIAALNE